MKKYISRNENMSRTLENDPRAFKQKTTFLQPKGIIQAVPLSPNQGCAISELNDANKRGRYFTAVTQTWFTANPGGNSAAIAAAPPAAVANVDYIRNPRTQTVNNRGELIRALNMNFMNNVTPIPNGFALAAGPLIPVQEFTFVLDAANVLHIAPNSDKSKFVHPNILGGWATVNSAGTLKMDATHIRIMNDSGHYRPGQAEIDDAHLALLNLVNNPLDKATAVRKFHNTIKPHIKYKKLAF